MVKIQIPVSFEHDDSRLDIALEPDFSVEFEAEEIYSISKFEIYEPVMKPITEEEFIKRHNKFAEKPNQTTGLPVPWEQETEERKQKLFKSEIYGGSKLVGYRETKHFFGYYIKTDKWVWLLKKESIID